MGQRGTAFSRIGRHVDGERTLLPCDTDDAHRAVVGQGIEKQFASNHNAMTMSMSVQLRTAGWNKEGSLRVLMPPHYESL